MRTAAVAVLLAAHATAPTIAQVAPAAWKENCQICHQADGGGLAGQFPRLSGRVATIAAKPEGRAYLTSVVLHGLAGRIVVDGAPIIGVMPGFATLSDADLAAALSFAARGPGKAGAFKAKDIAAARATPASGNAALVATRAALVASGTIP